MFLFDYKIGLIKTYCKSNGKPKVQVALISELEVETKCPNM